MLGESEEMTQGIEQFSRGTKVLEELSESNSRTAGYLEEEINRLGSEYRKPRKQISRALPERLFFNNQFHQGKKKPAIRRITGSLIFVSNSLHFQELCMGDDGLEPPTSWV